MGAAVLDVIEQLLVFPLLGETAYTTPKEKDDLNSSLMTLQEEILDQKYEAIINRVEPLKPVEVAKQIHPQGKESEAPREEGHLIN
jgi:hypothetical protein